MTTYKILEVAVIGGTAKTLVTGERTYIPFDPNNCDCAQFLSDWKAGAEVLDADGKPLPYSAAAVRALGLEPV